jgi:transposase InsO family protein
MSLIAQTLHVSRSNLIARVRRPAKPRGPYAKAGDAALLVLIREIVDQRASYGYRRVTAPVNRQLTAQGKPRVNAKRVLRIMRLHGLTLEKHTARRPGRPHDGVVMALRSNVRWCSDHLEIQCRNGEVVGVVFAIDACDREIIAWSAVTGAGISGEMVRDLMIVCVERRFGTTRTPHPVEWLSDHGSADIAAETAETAAALGLRLAFTPVRSPESNGICEALVKTLRRDDIRLAVLPDAASAMALLPGWIEDYNEFHPHSGLRFLPPREFRRLSA